MRNAAIFTVDVAFHCADITLFGSWPAEFRYNLGNTTHIVSFWEGFTPYVRRKAVELINASSHVVVSFGLLCDTQSGEHFLYILACV